MTHKVINARIIIPNQHEYTEYRTINKSSVGKLWELALVTYHDLAAPAAVSVYVFLTATQRELNTAVNYPVTTLLTAGWFLPGPEFTMVEVYSVRATSLGATWLHQQLPHDRYATVLRQWCKNILQRRLHSGVYTSRRAGSAVKQARARREGC